MADACMYVANSSATACPAEIHLQPQVQAVAELRLFVYRNEVPVRSQVQRDRRVVFLTGASRGVGRDAAIRLAQRGWDLALVARSQTELQATADLCTVHGVRVSTSRTLMRSRTRSTIASSRSATSTCSSTTLASIAVARASCRRAKSGTR